MKNMKTKLRFALIAGTMFLPASAYAQYTSVQVMNPWALGAQAQVYDEVVKKSVDQASISLSNTFNENTTKLIEALRLHAGQGTSNSQQRTQADAAMRETQDNRGVQQNIEGARYNAALAASSGAAGCNIMTGIVGATGLFNTQISVRNQLNQLALKYQFGEERDSALRNGTQAAVEERLAAVCKDYATQAMVDEGICKEVKQSDGNASKAFDGGSIIDSSVLTEKAGDAARVFLGNAFIPSPMSPISRSLAGTPEGIMQAAARWTSTARNSLAVSTFNDVIAVRTKVDESTLGNPGTINNANGTTTPTTTVRQWAEGTAKGMLGGKPDGQNFPNGISLWAWMDLRAKSFYLDPNFQAVVNKHDMNQNSKDMVLIMGFQTYLQWQQFKQAERTNVLLANMVSMMDQAETRASIGAR